MKNYFSALIFFMCVLFAASSPCAINKDFSILYNAYEKLIFFSKEVSTYFNNEIFELANERELIKSLQECQLSQFSPEDLENIKQFLLAPLKHLESCLKRKTGKHVGLATNGTLRCLLVKSITLIFFEGIINQDFLSLMVEVEEALTKVVTNEEETSALLSKREFEKMNEELRNLIEKIKPHVPTSENPFQRFFCFKIKDEMGYYLTKKQMNEQLSNQVRLMLGGLGVLGFLTAVIKSPAEISLIKKKGFKAYWRKRNNKLKLIGTGICVANTALWGFLYYQALTEINENKEIFV